MATDDAALAEVPVTLDQVEALARTMWKGESVPDRVLRFGAAVLGLADAAGVQQRCGYCGQDMLPGSECTSSASAGTCSMYAEFAATRLADPGVPASDATLPFDKWPKPARGAYEALEKHLASGPSLPLAYLTQIKVALTSCVQEVPRG